MSDEAIEFDHHEPGLDPVAAYAGLRRRGPLVWSESHGGFWVLTQRAALEEVVRNHDVFISGRNEYAGEGTALNIPANPLPIVAVPSESDPPDWFAYRRIFNEKFSPGAIKNLRLSIEGWVSTFIDAVIESGRCDLVYDIASPVPSCVILEYLGFPTDDWRQYAEPFHDSIGCAPGSPRFERAVEGLPWVVDQMRALIAIRRAEPEDDLVTFYIRQTKDGVPLNDEEVLSLIWQTVGGGVDTTTSLISSALVHLQFHQTDRRRLIDDPSLVPIATEEFLRYYPSVNAMARTAIDDIVVQGCPIRRGDRILVSWLSANHDELAFEHANQFILDRAHNRHVAFGVGIHTCPGRHIARDVFIATLTQILRRMPDYEIDLATLTRYPSQGTLGGWTSAEATFTPGPREAGV